MTKNIIVTAIVALVVSLGVVLSLPKDVVVTNESNFGGQSERDIKGVSLIVSGLTAVKEFAQGGGALTISQAGATRTLTEAELLGNNVIEITGVSPAAALTLTLPATSTMKTLLPNGGDMREWFIDNQHIAATTTTIAAGTGIDLIAYTTNDDVIDGQEVSRLTCWRKTVNRDVYCLVSENLKAD